MPEPAKPTKRDEVREKARGFIKESWQSQANLSFFLVMMVTVAFVLPSLGFGRDDAMLYADFVFSLLLISGVAIAWGRRWLFQLGIVIGSITIAIRWMGLLTPSHTLQVWGGIWSIAAILVIEYVLLTAVLGSGPVTANRIQGAIAVYLLFGVGWAHAYHVAELVHPGSFNVTTTAISSVEDWVYYSFVTLTTVGYGDITAVRPVARSLSIAEALTGQLYLAVLIARLVAMEVINWQMKNQSSE